MGFVDNSIFKRFKDQSVKNKLGLIFMLFAILAISTYISVTYYSRAQIADSALVDAAGRQRMLSQKIAFLSEMIVAANKDKYKEELQITIDLCDASLNALKQGGIAPGIANNSELPPTVSEIMPFLLVAENLWNEYERNARIIAESATHIEEIHESYSDDEEMVMSVSTKMIKNPEVVNALNFIEVNAGSMLSNFNQLTQEYVKNNLAKQQGMDRLLIVLLSLNIGLIALGTIIVNVYIRKPIKIIKQATQNLTKGELGEIYVYDSHDEFGQTINDINVLLQNLNKASQFAEKIGQGELVTDFMTVGENDKLGQSLIEMRDKLKKVAEEDKKRNWATTGFAQIGEILQQEQQNLEVLGDNILRFLIKYMNANQGGIFIINDDDENNVYMELVSLYAWDRKKYVNDQIKPGEGLAGQVWLEGETTYLKIIPKDYVHIKSGLGFENPNSVLIVPLKLNDNVYGVIEIASFEYYDDYQISFAEKIAESVASTISTAKINAKTKYLLSQTQQQTEEMRAQEEEMRQNMEELSATQEEMARKEKIYIQRIEELESANPTDLKS